MLGVDLGNVVAEVVFGLRVVKKMPFGADGRSSDGMRDNDQHNDDRIGAQVVEEGKGNSRNECCVCGDDNAGEQEPILQKTGEA